MLLELLKYSFITIKTKDLGYKHINNYNNRSTFENKHTFHKSYG